MSDEHRYKLSYKIAALEAHPEGLSREEALERAKDGWGACDAILVASIIYPSDGSFSVLFVGKDGRTNTKLSDPETLKVWSMLTLMLAESQALGTRWSDVISKTAKMIHETIAAAEGN